MRSTVGQRIENLKCRQTLTNDEIRRVAPSVFAAQAVEGVSDAYSFIPTIKVVDAMRQAGWLPVHAQEQPVKREGRRGFQKHMVRFWHSEQQAVAGEYMPEVSLINAHDRSSAYVLPVGLYKFTCGNGMMVSDDVIEAMRVRHSGCEIDDVVAVSMLLVDRIPTVIESVEKMRARLLSVPELNKFTEDALKLRFDDLAKAPIEPLQLANVRRNEDVGASLWSTFNRVQENLTLGRLKNYSRVDAKGKRFPKMRAVTGLAQNFTLNRELWSLAQSYVQN